MCICIEDIFQSIWVSWSSKWNWKSSFLFQCLRHHHFLRFIDRSIGAKFDGFVFWLRHSDFAFGNCRVYLYISWLDFCFSFLFRSSNTFRCCAQINNNNNNSIRFNCIEMKPYQILHRIYCSVWPIHKGHTHSRSCGMLNSEWLCDDEHSAHLSIINVVCFNFKQNKMRTFRVASIPINNQFF